MNLNIGGFSLKLPEINLPKLDLPKLDLSKGVEMLKSVAKDMFAPATNGKNLFNPELNIKLGSFDIKLKNPVEVLSEKLLGKLSEKAKEFGFNPDVIARMLTGNREVPGLGQVDMPKLPERVGEYAYAVGGGVNAAEEAGDLDGLGGLGGVEDYADYEPEIGGGTSGAASSVPSGADFGSMALEKFSGNISGLDSQIESLMNKGEDLTEVEMLKLQQQMQKRSQLFSMMSQIMQMEHDTKKQIIGNIR